MQSIIIYMCVCVLVVLLIGQRVYVCMMSLYVSKENVSKMFSHTDLVVSATASPTWSSNVLFVRDSQSEETWIQRGGVASWGIYVPTLIVGPVKHRIRTFNLQKSKALIFLHCRHGRRQLET